MSKISEIQSLVDHLNKALQEGDLTEARVRTDSIDVQLKRTPAIINTVAAAPVAAAPAAAAPAQAAAPASAGAEPAAPATPASGEVIKSPMVGTCYLSPEPGKSAFVSVGDTVAAGDTLMIIEAMKVMNTLLAPHAGTISEIMVADGSPIEFDQPLFVLS